jgi:Protein kinase domain
MMDNQDCRERASRHTHSKGAIKQITQTWSVMGEAFDLESRYKVIDYLGIKQMSILIPDSALGVSLMLTCKIGFSGAGAYGVVCAAQDSTENNVVAIKKCKKIFQSRTLAKRTLRELRLLRLFDHENVVKIKCVLKPLDAESFSEIYVVFEIMETDLAQIIRSPQTLKDQHVQYFTYQLLLALKYLHAANIVHRDLK